MMSNKRFLAVMLVVASAVSSAYAQFSGPAPLAWRWQQSVTDAPSGSPVVSDDPAQQNVVYVASGQRVYALNRNDGNQKWRYPSGEPLASNFKGTPLLINGMVIAAAANNTIYAIDQSTGELKWSYLAQSPVVGTLVSNDKILAFSLGDRSIMALNLADGTPFYANSDGSANPLNIIDGITGKLSIWNDDVLVISGGRTLYSINIATRKTVWKVAFDDLGPDVKPAVTKTGIYLNSGTFLIGLSAGTGFTEFQKDTGTPLAFSPTVYGVNIGVVSKDGKFFEYDQLGHQVLKNPIDLGSDPFTAPTALPNGLFVVPTSNGSINLIDPKQGVIWDYPVRPIGGVQDAPESTKRGGAGGKGGFGGAGGGLSGGGLGGGLGGDSSSFGGGQGGLGGGVNGQQRKKKIVTIQAAGPAIIAGNTLLLLGRDGSLLAFDKDLGVDLTAPTVKMTFPNPGDQVNPGAPLELVFQIEDEASGVKTSSLKVSVDGKPLEYVLTPEGFAVVKFSLEGKNKPMRDGRHKIVVEVSDWMGNVRHEEFILTADSTLAPVILPGTETKNGKGGLGGLGGKGGGLGGGGLGGGQGSNE